MSAQRWNPVKEPRERGSFRWRKYQRGRMTIWRLELFHAPMAVLQFEIAEWDVRAASARHYTAWRLQRARAALRKQAALRRAYVRADGAFIDGLLRRIAF